MNTNSDLTYSVKLAIATIANRHRPSGAPNIGMFSSRRSGTTLVSEVFSRSRGIKTIDQPLSQYTASAGHSRFLPPFAGSYPYNLSDEDRERLRELFVGWHEGRLHYSEPWRVYAPTYRWRTNRLFFKFTEGQAVISELASFVPMVTFAFFRHPIPHAMSCQRLGWSARSGNFLQQDALLESHFDPVQIAFIKQVDRSGEEFERILVNWFVENAPLYRSVAEDPSRIPAFTYEDLVLEPEREITRIARHCGVPVNSAMMVPIGQASRSSRARVSGSEVSMLIKGGDRTRLVGSWQSRIRPTDLESAKRIFDVLGCEMYSPNSPLPGGPAWPRR